MSVGRILATPNLIGPEVSFPDGVVTQVSPLLVAVGADPVGRPATSGAPLAVGDKVIVLVRGADRVVAVRPSIGLLAMTEDFATTTSQVGIGVTSIGNFGPSFTCVVGDIFDVTINAYITAQTAGATYVDLYVDQPPAGGSAQVPGSILALYPLAAEGTYARRWKVAATSAGTITIAGVLRQVAGGTGSVSSSSSIVIAHHGIR